MFLSCACFFFFFLNQLFHENSFSNAVFQDYHTFVSSVCLFYRYVIWVCLVACVCACARTCVRECVRAFAKSTFSQASFWNSVFKIVK